MTELFQAICGITLLVALFALYFLPTLVALGRGHRNAGAIIAVNLLIGWMFIGWVIALVWAMTENVGQSVCNRHPKQWRVTR